jgi:hypothetical protein
MNVESSFVRRWSEIEVIIRELGYEPPVLCTPEELLEE